MRGHESIVAMRRQGMAPRFVWLTAHPDGYAGDGVSVRIEPEDVPERLDLRFLVGLTALVEGPEAERVDRIAAACTKVAKRVISNTMPGRDVVRITDTEGVLSWPN